jgi:transcriptional regulator with XRE-family HTH domain
MIKNDRQYKITKAQAEKFRRALAAAHSAAPPHGVAPAIHKAQVAALRSQLEDLRTDLAEYDSLRAGKSRVLELTSLDELPQALIRARIASGMTQRDLAERLGLKEQQIQRYEATNYMSASLARIKDVADALSVKIREEVFLPGVNVSLEALLARLKGAGIDPSFVEQRLLPAKAVDALDPAELRATESLGLHLSGIVNRIFGWPPSALFGDQAPLPSVSALAVRFKVPANAKGRRTVVLAVYARYLAGLVLQATDLPQKPVPTDAATVRNDITRPFAGLSLHACLEYGWQLGIPVLPLQDTGGFHAAAWRLSGRNVIVLKQNTRSMARWIHDFLHELRHAGEDPSASEFDNVDLELASKERRESPEERAATVFAGDVALDGRAEALVDECVREAHGRIQRLEAVVPCVAGKNGVPTNSLANYLAFQLALQGINWWGAATNLQPTNEDPWQEARDFLLDRLDFSRLAAVDRAILHRALESD